MELSGTRLTIVAQSSCPRFAYTIGLKRELGFDFLIPGMSRYSGDELVEIVDRCAASKLGSESHVRVPGLGDFLLRDAHSSWVEMMALGAIEYYGSCTPFVQIAQNPADSTIDTPDASNAWSALEEPAWKWLKEPWTFAVPEESTATTNLAALRGERVTEAARWENGEWELFAGSGPDTPKDELRVLPLGTFLASDPSTSRVLELEVGQAVWRDSSEIEWHDWVRST